MTITRYQTYGERCCGTNYVIKLLERNVVEARFCEDFGFKHWFVDDELVVPDDVLVLLITRELVPSLQSLHRTPWHVHEDLQGLEFSAFLRARWHCVWDERFWGVGPDDPRWQTEMEHERDPASGERFENVVRMRRAKEDNWRALIARSRHGAVLRYEDAVADPAGFLAQLAARFGLVLRPQLVPVADDKGNGNERWQPTRYPPMAPADLAFIEAQWRAGAAREAPTGPGAGPRED